MINPLESTDQALVTAAQTGNSTAVAVLYDRYATLIYRWSLNRVDHRQAAEDLTSDIMLRMVENLPTYHATASFKNWLFGIARNVLADFWRAHYRQPIMSIETTAELDAAPPPTTEHEASDDQLRQQALEVINRLPDNYRTVIQHRFFDQHSLSATAKAMDTSVANVKVLQHRALKKAAQLAASI